MSSSHFPHGYPLLNLQSIIPVLTSRSFPIRQICPNTFSFHSISLQKVLVNLKAACLLLTSHTSNSAALSTQPSHIYSSNLHTACINDAFLTSHPLLHRPSFSRTAFPHHLPNFGRTFSGPAFLRSPSEGDHITYSPSSVCHSKLIHYTIFGFRGGNDYCDDDITLRQLLT